MTEAKQPDPLLVWFGKIRDQTITPSELSELESTLLDDPEALRRYRQFMAICSGLEQIAQLKSDGESQSSNLMVDGGAFDWADDIPEFAELPTKVEPPSDPANTARVEAAPVNPHRKVVAAVMAIASIAAVIFFAVVGLRQPAATSGFARLIESHQPIWGEQVQYSNGDRLLATAHSLSSGAVRLRYDNGVELLVQAPATFAIDSPVHASLQAGSLTATVPASGAGFRVTTQWASVIDHGTRIGIFVDEDEGMEVHVFEGKAEVVRSGRTAGEMTGAGQAVSLTTADAEFQEIEAKPSRFSKSIETLRYLPIVSGDVELHVSAPRSVRRVRSDLVEAKRATIFAERQAVRLDEPLPVTLDSVGVPKTFHSNDVMLPAGLLVDTYLVHFATPKSMRRTDQSVIAEGTIRFDRPVLGVVAFETGKMDERLFSPETDYPRDRDTGLEDPGEGLHQFADHLNLSDDRRTITFRLNVRGHEAAEEPDFLDQFRVLLKSKP